MARHASLRASRGRCRIRAVDPGEGAGIVSARVYLSEDGPLVRIKPSYLGDRFDDYLKAVEGARYDRKRGASYAPLDRAEYIVQRLRDAGLDHEATPELRTRMQRTTKAQWNDLIAVRDRIEVFNRDMLEESCGIDSLRPFQCYGAQWLATRRGGALFDDQGTGKTLQTIAAIPANTPILVICPTIAKGVWSGEVARFRPQIKTITLKGRGSFRWPNPGEMVIINYDIMPDAHDRTLNAQGKPKCDGKLPPEPCEGCRSEITLSPIGGLKTKMVGHLPKCTGFKEKRPYCPGCAPFLKLVKPGTTVVLDEAHYLKSPSAARTISCRAIAREAREADGRSWPLTGTPMSGDPRELWSILAVAGIAEEAFGSFQKLVELFKGQRIVYGASGRVGYEWGDAADVDQDEIVERLKRVALRRMKVDVLAELPPKRWRVRPVDIDAKAYARCEKFVAGIDLEKMITQIEQGREELKFEGLSAIRAALATAKIPAMIEMVKDAESRKEPLVVFSVHRAPIELLAKRKGWAAIMGGMKEDKKEVADRFQRGELRGVACTIDAGAESITLTRANEMLYVDLHWNPNKNAQSSDRIWRFGQKRDCICEILSADHPLDQRVTEVLNRKTRLIERTIDAASDDDDAPKDAVFEEEIRARQEAVAGERAVRRQIECREECDAVEKLRIGLFEKTKDVHFANSLLQQFDAIGLSDAQWRFVVKLAAQCELPPLPADPPVRESASPPDQEEMGEML